MKSLDNGLIVHNDDIGATAPATNSGQVEVAELGFESTVLTGDNEWDKAHKLYRQNKNRADIKFIEPDYKNVFEEEFPNLYVPAEKGELESFKNQDYCAGDINYDNNWTYPLDKIKQIWHLTDQFSQLESARGAVAAILEQRNHKTLIRIAHFDTGYDQEHITFPKEIVRRDLERNFSGTGDLNNAEDEGEGLNGGHGCGTLSILAGQSFENDFDFTKTIGLSSEHGIEIVPVRIARSVVLFRSRAFEMALEYILSLYDDPEKRCHIITMSMGGAPTRDWAKLVNKAYDKGIFIVTAAGNNFGGVSPRTLVYPARFNRVVAACGVTYDMKPYYKFEDFPQIKIMQGNYGPRRFMRTAIAAFTPNVPWAKFGCKDKVSLSGAGTSSATPQIAAAAALYYQKYYNEIENAEEGWQKVEIIRKALFTSSSKGNSETDCELYFGNGILKANNMLDVLPHTNGIRKEEKDSVFLPILQLLTEIVTSESFMDVSDVEEEMFELEIQQLILNSKELQQFLNNEEKNLEELSLEEREEFARIISNLPEASQTLKDYIKLML